MMIMVGIMVMVMVSYPEITAPSSVPSPRRPSVGQPRQPREKSGEAHGMAPAITNSVSCALETRKSSSTLPRRRRLVPRLPHTTRLYANYLLCPPVTATPQSAILCPLWLPRSWVSQTSTSQQTRNQGLQHALLAHAS